MKCEGARALTVSALFLAAACSSGSGGSIPPGGGQTGTGGAGQSATGGAQAGGGGAGGAATAGTGGQTMSGTGGANAGSGGANAAASDGGGADAAASAWPAITDYAAKGPFPTQRDTNVGPNAGYDVFRPMELGAGGRQHPIISWNNGTMYALDQYAPLLDHLASHGFVVVAAHTNTTAGGAVHKAGIDWAVAQNAAAQGIYAGKLDITKIGAAGHSQGGGATLAAAADKPGPTGIIATMPLMPIMSFEKDQTILGKQTAPLLIVSATMDDRSTAVANDTFTAITTEYINAQFKGVHADAMNAAMHAPALAWFRFLLMGDQTAKAFFYPAMTCGLCKDPGWMMVRYKNTP
ncbi:MAG TPA: hypothetical protein VMU50_12345 [Polyangia bacterium]|nr:hypothetical protein [Polyangia bacterium]